MATTTDTLEQRIAEWRTYLCRRQAIHAYDVDELEDHLRDQIGALADAGLSEDEAFLVAVKRMGDLDSVSMPNRSSSCGFCPAGRRVRS